MKKLLSAVLVFALALFVTACGNGGTGAGNTRTITNSQGEDITIPANVERVVAGAPSVVEIMTGLGQQEKLVAIDSYSTDVEGAPEGIVTFDSLSPDTEALLALDPDIIITSDMSVMDSSSNPYQTLVDQGVTVVYTQNAVSLEGIEKDIVFLADILGVKDQGEAMVADMETKIDEYRAIGASITEKKKVYFEIDSEPSLYSFGSGNFLNEIIELIGAENIFADQDGWITPNAEAVITAAPDVIVTNAGYRTDPVGTIKSRAGWKVIPAVANDEVYLVDANATSRPTQNIVNGIGLIAKAVYPEYFK